MLKMIWDPQCHACVFLLLPPGYLVLRTVGTTATYALATSLAARAGAVHAAAHQVRARVGTDMDVLWVYMVYATGLILLN